MSYQQAIQAGIDLLEKGDFDGALATFVGVDQAFPGRTSTHRLMGTTFLRMGRHQDGARLLLDVVRRDPDPEAIFQLTWALTHLGAYQDVETVCRHFAPQIGSEARFLPNLGFAQLQLGRYSDAYETLSRAKAAMPDIRAVYHNLSIALLGLGRGEEAVACYSELLPDWIGDTETPTAIEQLDAISKGYDGNELHNFFSDRLLRLYRGAFPDRPMMRVLELGTGTGLLAAKLVVSAVAVTGIERSPAMLEQARNREAYDQLIEGCLPQILETVDGRFETVLSSCVLYYFGDLEPFFHHAARLLEPGGVFLFSVDPLNDPREIAVSKPGEYAHSRAYLRRLAAGTGFEEAAIEIDRHRGPPGFWCAFRKVS